MRTRKWIPVILPFGVGLLGSTVRWPPSTVSESWGPVLAGIYYIPVVIAALSLGRVPSLIVALAAGVCHGAAAVLRHDVSWVHLIAQTVMFVCVALTAAALAEWIRAGAVRPALQPPPNSLKKSFSEGQDTTPTAALSRVVVDLVRQFRTPLTSIEGAGWVLEDSRLPDEKRQEFVGIVRKESHRLNRILSDVLDFARTRKPRLRTVELSLLVDEVLNVAGARDRVPLYLFHKEIPPDFPPLRCDPPQIRQVLLNLVMNSIQASPGGGRIEISAAVDQDNAVIRVKDHGRGIPPEFVDKIFEPFFTTNENSVGLGLPVALHIVTEHGGRMAIEPDSDRGAGACVSVILPLSHDR